MAWLPHAELEIFNESDAGERLAQITIKSSSQQAQLEQAIVEAAAKLASQAEGPQYQEPTGEAGREDTEEKEDEVEVEAESEMEGEAAAEEADEGSDKDEDEVEIIEVGAVRRMDARVTPVVRASVHKRDCPVGCEVLAPRRDDKGALPFLLSRTPARDWRAHDRSDW